MVTGPSMHAMSKDVMEILCLISFLTRTGEAGRNLGAYSCSSGRA